MDKATAIATWAETIAKPPAPNKDRGKDKPAYKRSNAERIVSILRMAASGRTQTAIAQELGMSQPSVHAILAKYGRNTSKEARQILEAKAADMALNVARNGRPADQLRALEGLSVIDLREKPQPGLSITINGFALVGLGLQGERSQEPQHRPTESDKCSYVNEANSLIIEDITAQTRTDSEADPGAGIAGGPQPEGLG